MRPSLALPTLLAGCATRPPPPVAPPAVAAASPSAVPRDGVSRGQSQVLRDRDRQCGHPSLGRTGVRLQGGEARLLNPALGINGRGTVSPDGAVDISDSKRGGPFRFAGRLEGDRASGQPRNGHCAFGAELTRAG